MPPDPRTHEASTQERVTLLQQLDAWLETPMQVLAFVWLALLVVELLGQLTPLLETIGMGIWGLFLLDFGVRVTLAPRKWVYLTRNWITVLALLVPALRVVRLGRAVQALRVTRAARGLRLVRLLSGLNRGIRALRATMRRRGVGYVLALTLLVLLAGAAGMYALEGEVADERGLHDYGTALWWTAMLMTTMGSEYWPRTAEGRALCVLLALYAFAVFGYVTATLTTFFLGRDAEREDGELAGATALEAIRAEMTALRTEVQALAHRLPTPAGPAHEEPPQPGS